MIRNLLRTRTDLIRERDELTSLIDQLGEQIVRFGGSLDDEITGQEPLPQAPTNATEAVNWATDSRLGGGSPTAPRPHVVQLTTREALLQMMEEDKDRVFEMKELISGVHERGVQAAPETVRSALQKLIEKHEVERPVRGKYKLVLLVEPRRTAENIESAASYRPNNHLFDHGVNDATSN